MKFKIMYLRSLLHIKLIVVLSFLLSHQVFPPPFSLCNNSDFSNREMCAALKGGGEISRVMYILIWYDFGNLQGFSCLYRPPIISTTL